MKQKSKKIKYNLNLFREINLKLEKEKKIELLNEMDQEMQAKKIHADRMKSVLIDYEYNKKQKEIDDYNEKS